MLENELDILMNVDHPNIMKFYEVYQDRKHLHFVNEFCRGGDLFEYILKQGTIDESEVAIITIKLLGAIKHLHDKRICHRDLKPENILFDSEPKSRRKYPEIKLTDFGLSKMLEPDQKYMKTKLGTPYYISPEILKGHYSLKSDLWSIGVIIFVLLSGAPPFNANNEMKLFQKI